MVERVQNCCGGRPDSRLKWKCVHIIVSHYFWCILHILLLRTIPEYDDMLLFKNLNHFLRLGLLLFLSLEWIFSLTPISASTFHSQNTETRILFPYAIFWISVFAPHVLVVLFKLPILMLVTIILLFMEFEAEGAVRPSGLNCES